MAKKIKVTVGSKNVYADMGYANPEEALIKAKIANLICDLVNSRNLSQSESARILKIDQPRVSDLMCGRLKRFSTEKLFEFLNALGQDIEIRIKKKPSSHKYAEVRVVAA